MSETETLPKPALSQEDKERIRGCNLYLHAKEIIKSCEDYREYEVGSAIYISHKNSKNFISSGYGDGTPDKFLIVENDNGFLFVKRITASGKPGVAITCVTIDFPSAHYDLKVDDGYIESMLLDTQASYDPSADVKAIAKRKNKASRENNKKRLVFDNAILSHNFLKSLKIGDTLYSSEYSYGGAITEYKVDSIDVRPAVKGAGNGYWGSRGDDDYLNEGLIEVVEVKLKALTSTAKYFYDKTLKFKDLSKQHYAQYSFFYLTKPISPDDLAK